LAAKRVVRYLKGTPSIGLNYVGDSGQLLAFSDADFASCIQSRKSTSGCLLVFNGSPVCWTSRKQTIVRTSTTEAEYIAAHDTARQLIWIRRFLIELGQNQLGPTLMYIDNTAAKHLIKNPSHHKRTKHIDVKFHFTRNMVHSKEIELVHIGTKDQLADIFTKALPKTSFKSICNRLNLIGPN
jgi:hypothetical protein